MNAYIPQKTPGWQLIFSIIRIYFTITVPVLLTLFSARMVMTPVFLELEYNRSGFPNDQYGFTQQERLHYATYAIEYLFNDSGISYLSDLTFPDGFRLYTESELAHMEDVKKVTKRAFQVLTIGGSFTVLLGLGLWWRRDKRHVFCQGLFRGSVFTLGIIGGVVVAAVIAWDLFFTSFHQIFFESGTWRFAYSDTLIRLFPQQFWFDAALTVGTMTAAEAVIILGITWRQRGPNSQAYEYDADGNECH